MLKIKNYDEVVSAIAREMKEHDLQCRNYEVDVYLYVDSDGTGTIETFTNIGGNSWLEDDHITVTRMREVYENPINCFETAELPDIVGKTMDELKKEASARFGWDLEYIDCYTIRDLCENVPEYAEKVLSAYSNLLDDHTSEYEESARVALEYALSE